MGEPKLLWQACSFAEPRPWRCPFAPREVAQAAAQIFPTTRRVLNLTPVGWPEFLSIAAIALGGTAINDVLGYFLPERYGPVRSCG